ncbi:MULTISPECIES: hypothetical protein [Henriciella]|uniref:hypothetical protein n=1 Tax=Henriciella TaxID=453849 RepID=UPI0035149381
MNLLRNILTAIWCAVIIGLNVFGLITLIQVVGLDGAISAGAWLWTAKLALMAVLGVMSLASTKFLWAVLAVAVLWMLLGVSFDLLAQRTWRSGGLQGALFTIIPTYLLARWNTAVRKAEFNPVKEF